MPSSTFDTLTPLAPLKRQRHTGKLSGDSPRIPRQTTPQLSVVIVNYCQWEETAALVRQITRTPAARNGAVEVVVVDNHSPPHPLAFRMRRWPGVSVRRWGRNRGFARAVNEGCRLSRGKWCLLLNPDVALAANFLQGTMQLANRLDEGDPSAGIVGFQLYDSDGQTQLSSGKFPTLQSTLLGLLRPRAIRKCQVASTDQTCQVDWVTGCCLLLRRECLEDLGGLDDSYFMYYEDVDLCRRARDRGWTVWFEPRWRAVHYHPSHQRHKTPALRLVARHSLLTYASRHWPRWQYGLLTGIVRLESWIRRLRACLQVDRSAATIFSQIGRLARNLWQGNATAARKRLTRVLRNGDPRYG